MALNYQDYQQQSTNTGVVKPQTVNAGYAGAGAPAPQAPNTPFTAATQAGPRPATGTPSPGTLAPAGSPVTASGKIAPAQPMTPQQQYPTMQGGNMAAGVPGGGPAVGYPMGPYPTVDPSGAESQQYANLMTMLQNPYSMSPDLVNQMKGANRDEAAMLQKQMLDQIHNSTASRGLQVGGGWDAMQQRNAGTQAIQQILQGNRAIDMQAATTNHQDLLNALQAGSGALGSGEDRNLSAAQMALQRALGIGGLNMDQNRLNEQGREYNMGNQLSWADLMNNMVMGRAGYGLNLAQLQQGNQNNMFNWMNG